MHRIDTAGNVGGLFANPDPVHSQIPVVVDAAWLNDVQENLMALLTAAGIAPVKGAYSQVLSSIQTGAFSFAADTGAANAIVAAISPAPAALTDGLTVHVRVAATNTAAVTLNLNGLGAKTVQVQGAAVPTGTAIGGHTYPFIWNATAAVWDLIAHTPGVSTGAIAFYAVSTAPTGWLECNGAAISRTTYSALYAVIGTTFGAGDGSTTFNLPDLRGQFIRGYDHSRGVDSGRTFGSTQADAFKSHSHTINGATGIDPYVVSVAGSVSESPGALSVPHISGTDATGGAETRPTNVALLPCIKF